MISEKMLALGTSRSAIREIFEYAKIRAAQIGAENIYDFSLGNPSVPAPACVNQTIAELVTNEDSVVLHGYTSAQGDLLVRKAMAAAETRRSTMEISPDCIYMTCGAAASLAITLHALILPGDDVVAMAPFFPEYRVFVETAGAKFVSVPPRPDDFQPDLEKFSNAILPATKAVIVNSPNNPSGVVLSRETLVAMCGVLKERSARYGHPIYLISDEPYRELVFSGVPVPFLPEIYDDTVVCYSYSKALSLPGERIGYVLVSPAMRDFKMVYAAVCGAGRALGYVCAPSLFQRVVARCAEAKPDISAYRRNRDLLYGALTEYGFNCVHPDGAFYLFVKAPEPDAAAFCERAKKFELLLVPSDSFGIGGYVRIAYCVSWDMIKRALPAFKKLAEECGLPGR